MTALAAAARREVASRAKHYPALVAAGKLTADDATIDYQAWHCILGFVESGQFHSIDGGGIDGRTLVGWPRAQAAADRAVAEVARAQADAAGNDAKAERLAARLAQLKLIADMVRRRHALIDSINRRLRADRLANGERRAA